MQRYISFSGGVESTTMCILFGKGAKAIFADTGAEHPELYERLNLVRDYCTKLHDGDFELIQVRADRYTNDGTHFDNLTDYIVHEEYMPNVNARFCTRLFKIEPIERYLRKELAKSIDVVMTKKGDKVNWQKTYAKYDGKKFFEMQIGLNLDESDRTGNLEEIKLCNYSYPLVNHVVGEDVGLDRDDCIEILNIHGLNPDFPVYMLRGGCKYCFFKRESEYKAMCYLDNKTFQEVKQLEKDIQGTNKSFFTIMPNRKSMDQLERECQSVLFSENEMKSIYSKVEKTTYCGGFCHR